MMIWLMSLRISTDSSLMRCRVISIWRVCSMVAALSLSISPRATSTARRAASAVCVVRLLPCRTSSPIPSRPWRVLRVSSCASLLMARMRSVISTKSCGLRVCEVIATEPSSAILEICEAMLRSPSIVSSITLACSLTRFWWLAISSAASEKLVMWEVTLTSCVSYALMKSGSDRMPARCSGPPPCSSDIAASVCSLALATTILKLRLISLTAFSVSLITSSTESVTSSRRLRLVSEAESQRSSMVSSPTTTCWKSRVRLRHLRKGSSPPEPGFSSSAFTSRTTRARAISAASGTSASEMAMAHGGTSAAIHTQGRNSTTINAAMR
jgi:hypothetical protein